MKLPNGFGSVYKLKGTRRKPWCARKTTGFTWNEEKQKSYPIYQYIGYYESRKEALEALVEFNKDPYEPNTATFEEVYINWSTEHFKKVCEANVRGYKTSYKLCDSIKNMKMQDIKLNHLQKIVDDSGKNTPTLRKLKGLFGMVFDYAVKYEIVAADKRNMVRYVDISEAGNPNGFTRSPFNRGKIKTLWKYKDSNEYLSVVLMLIYTGLRIGELLDLKKENVNLEEKWFDVVASKTQSGIRKVPIADKVLPFFKEWYAKNDCEYLISSPEGNHLLYKNYYDSYWTPLMKQLDMAQHKPHDTRHTCVSLLTSAGVDDRVIKRIIGHKGQTITETVYTHFEIDELLNAINKI
ncbi:DNA integration/recombination/inversion protein [Lachnospiraceae bacterium TWA4]|nr:DNA integration/recombination/inversion protein [Lachnospiraceae bacterium TWA4]